VTDDRDRGGRSPHGGIGLGEPLDWGRDVRLGLDRGRLVLTFEYRGLLSDGRGSARTAGEVGTGWRGTRRPGDGPLWIGILGAGEADPADGRGPIRGEPGRSVPSRRARGRRAGPDGERTPVAGRSPVGTTMPRTIVNNRYAPVLAAPISDTYAVPGPFIRSRCFLDPELRRGCDAAMGSASPRGPAPARLAFTPPSRRLSSVGRRTISRNRGQAPSAGLP
jgi:hypothetical protein